MIHFYMLKLFEYLSIGERMKRFLFKHFGIIFANEERNKIIGMFHPLCTRPHQI